MEKKTFGRIGLALFLMVVLSILLQVLCALGGNVLISAGYVDKNNSWLFWLLTFLPIYGVGFPVGLLVLRRLPAQAHTGSKLGAKNFFVLMLIGFFLMYAGNLVGNLLSSALSGGNAQNALVDIVLDSSPLKILVMVVLAPVLEELVFRKAIIDRCEQYGEKTAVVLSAVAFALFHMNLFQLFYAFALGLLFAYVYIRTHRICYPIIMHMIINFMGSVVAPWILSLVNLELLSDPEALMNLTEQAVLELLPGMAAYFLYAMLLFGMSIAGLVLFILKVRKVQFLPAAEELPKEQRIKTVYGNVWMILFVAVCLGFCVYALFP